MNVWNKQKTFDRKQCLGEAVVKLDNLDLSQHTMTWYKLFSLGATEIGSCESLTDWSYHWKKKAIRSKWTTSSSVPSCCLNDELVNSINYESLFQRQISRIKRKKQSCACMPLMPYTGTVVVWVYSSGVAYWCHMTSLVLLMVIFFITSCHRSHIMIQNTRNSFILVEREHKLWYRP